jgi:16S rRNA (guanine(527)-N(7))-methyltransferase RsmG
VKNSETSTKITDFLSRFSQQFNLSAIQIQQFQKYSALLREWNKKINLTGITDPVAIINDHFQDSLMISSFFDFHNISMLGDIGTGAGFPGIPLKIYYPQLEVVLIEVTHKKIIFLETLIKELSLKNVTITALDWRTFLRKTSYPINLFLARASLSIEELIRMFKPASPYHNAQLIYWASHSWSIPVVAQPFVQREEGYMIKGKKRRYIFFKRH